MGITRREGGGEGGGKLSGDWWREREGREKDEGSMIDGDRKGEERGGGRAKMEGTSR